MNTQSNKNTNKFWSITQYFALWLIMLLGLSACTQEAGPDYVPPGIEKPALYKQLRAMLTSEGGPFLSQTLSDGTELKYFVRWETPIRYYLTGFEDHPEYEAFFEQKITEMARLTGLDIARHDAIYHKSFTPINQSPDGMQTNATFFFSKDMKATYFDPRVAKILSAWKKTSKGEYETWRERKETYNYDGIYASKTHGVKKKGYVFFINIEEIATILDKYKDKQKADDFIKFSILRSIYNSVIHVSHANFLRSTQNINAYGANTRELTSFDKLFLEELYSKENKSGYGAYNVLDTMYDRLKPFEFEKVEKDG